MIFLGDIASPTADTCATLRSLFSDGSGIFARKKIVCNLEGMIADGRRPESRKPVLYNHPDVVESMHTGQSPLFCLANNHTLDLPEYFDRTASLILKQGSRFAGAGGSIQEASAPVAFEDAGQRIVLFNACWDFLLYNHPNPRAGIHVREIREKELLGAVQEQKAADPGSRVVVFLHWSLDLEILPFPMYRLFAKDLVDAGASVVVGCHSHCVQGGERHGEGYIVYGLGNFYIPGNHFIGGKLVYPDFSSLELALEWDPRSNQAACHWFNFGSGRQDTTPGYMESEPFDSSGILEQHTPYRNMNEEAYLEYFRKNRRKGFLVPVYSDYRMEHINRMKTTFLKGRAHVARTLARAGLRGWLR